MLRNNLPPSLLENTKPKLLGAVGVSLLAAAGLAILLVVPVPIRGRAISSFMDLMHAPAFALLAILVCNAAARKLPQSLWARLLLVALPLALCGLLAEVLQIFVHRGASWHDARANLFGACAGVCLYHLQNSNTNRQRWLLTMVTLGLFACASVGPVLGLSDWWRQQSQFPLMASFESPLEVTRFIAQESKFKRVPLSVDETQWGLQIELQPGLYPGILLDGMPADWSRYEALAFDVTVDSGPPLPLIVKVHDREHMARGYEGDDRFDGQFRLQPGTHHIRIPLAQIESAPRTRLMDMSDIEGWQLFTYHLTQPRTIVVDNLRLE